MTKKRHTYSILLGITLMALILRTWNLTGVPAGFFCDEASTGYNAYTILTKGADEYGKKFPFFFESFGIWRPPVSMYATVPFVLLFGLSEFSTRFSASVIGMLTVVVIFFLTRILTGNTRNALFSSLLLAISPWHIHFSRVGLGIILFPFLATLSMYLYLFSEKKRSALLWIGTGISFSLTLYTYFPAYFLTPQILALFILTSIACRSASKRTITVVVLSFCLCLTPFLFNGAKNTVFNRFTQVTKSNQQKTNKEILRGMAKTYLQHFSPDFLFLKGDIGIPGHFIKRNSVRGMGQLYLFQFPLLLAGAYILLIRQRKTLCIIGGLLLLYPLGSTLAPFADGGGPFATRSLLGIIPFTILSAVGLDAIISFWKDRWMQTYVYVLCMTLMVWSFGLFAYEYMSRYNLYASNYWGWQFGAKPVMEYFLAHKDEYDDLFLTDEFNGPEIFAKFYDPTNHCSGKCRIGNPDEKNRNPTRRQVFAISASREKLEKILTGQYLLKDTVLYPDGSPAFYIITFPQLLQSEI